MPHIPLRKLTNQDRAQVYAYIHDEPEINLFLYGDVEAFGLEGDTVEGFAAETADGWDYLLLRYLDNFLLYSRREAYDVSGAAAFLNARSFNGLSGKCGLLEQLVPLLPGRVGQPTFMARLNAVQNLPQMSQSFGIRRLVPDDARPLVEFYTQIKEFRATYFGCEEKAVEEKRLSLSTHGRCWGAFQDGKLVATASSAAENSISAMVVGVATLPACRRQGLAGGLVGRLCTELLQDGKKFLCLFYDNPLAGSIYHRIGFEKIGRYMLVKRRLTPDKT